MTEGGEKLRAKVMPVDRGTRVAVCIQLYCTDINGNHKTVGFGTGFFRRYLGRDWLVTNWHVLAGRSPENPQRLLDGYPDSPTSFQIHLPRASNPNHFVPSEIYPLYENGNPTWIETKAVGPAAGQLMDLAAVQFEFDGDDPPLIQRVEEFARDNMTLRIGRDVLIVGYPFGIRPENPYAMWKRGFVASEPSTLIEGLPKFYIDSPGRPGMSGSPVFMITPGLGVSSKTHELLTAEAGSAFNHFRQLDVEELANAPEVNILRFAGVYSGSVGDANLDQLRVGVAWHAFAVDQLFANPRPGGNPFPPVNAE